MTQNRGPTDRQKKSPSAVFSGTYDTRGLGNEVNTSLQNHTTFDSVSQGTSKTHENRFRSFFPQDDLRRWYKEKYCKTDDFSDILQDATDPETSGQASSEAEPSEDLAGESGHTYLINEHKSSTPLTARVYENFIIDGDGGGDNSLLERISRFEEAKKRSAQLVNYLHQFPWDDNMKNRANKLSYCGSILMFRDYLEYGESRLQGGMFCGQPKLCMGCAIRRSSRLLRDLVTKVTEVLYNANMGDDAVFYGDKKPLLPYLVTFTVRDGESLSERFSHLDRSITFCADRSRRIRNGGRNSKSLTEWSKSEGTFLSYEFKRGKNSDLWHPHCHAVWLCRKKPNVYKLREEWYNVTSKIPSSTDPSFIVDVRPFQCNDSIYSMAKRGCYDFKFVQDILASDLVEVCKYSLKLTDMDPVDTWDASQILFDKRMVRTYGSLYGVKINDLIKHLYEPSLDGKYVDYVLGWQQSSNEYVCRDVREGFEN